MVGRRFVGGVLALAASATLALVGEVSAEPVPLGEPFLITARPADSSFMHTPSSAYDAGRDRFLLVMYSTAQTMLARMIGPDGQPQSDPITIAAAQHTWGSNVHTGDLQGDHDVVYNPTTDEYLVIWSQGTGPNSQGANGARWNTVFGQRFSASSGAAVTQPTRLNELRGDSAWCSVRYPVAEYNPADGGYVVVWNHVLHNGRGVAPGCPGLAAGVSHQLELVRLSGAAVPVGSPTVLPGSANEQSDVEPIVRIARHSSGEFLVSQRVLRVGESATRVLLRRVSSTGELVGEPVELDTELKRGTGWAVERPDGNWLVLGYVIGGAVKAYTVTPQLTRVGERVDVRAPGKPSPSGVVDLVALGDGTFAMVDADDSAVFQLGPTGVPMGARFLPATGNRLLVSAPDRPILVAGRGSPQRVPSDSPLRNAMTAQRIEFGPGPASLGGNAVSRAGRRCFAVAGLPGDVALVNITPVQAAGAGNGQLVSSDVTTAPAASNVNFAPGTVDPNVAAAPIGLDGQVCYVNSSHTTVHVIADHLGTISQSAITLATPSGAPSRKVDTRSGLGGGLVGPNGRVCFAVAGAPGDVALVNLTPVQAAGGGNGQLVSSDVATPPAASNVNFGPGTVDPNVAAAPLGADGQVCFVNSRHTSVHVIADHLGTIAESAITLATPSGAPSRKVDTRTGLGGGLIGPDGRVCFAVAGSPGDVALVNLTPVGAAGGGNGQLVSSDVATPPAASNVNFAPGTVDPNVAAAPIGADGQVCFVNSRHTSVHLIADHLGTVSGSAFRPATASGAPDRRLDTRPQS